VLKLYNVLIDNQNMYFVDFLHTKETKIPGVLTLQ